MAKKSEKITFEAAFSRLESVVASMENDHTTLEESIALYKEGVALSAQCAAVLENLEAEILQVQKDGSITPFVPQIFPEYEEGGAE